MLELLGSKVVCVVLPSTTFALRALHIWVHLVSQKSASFISSANI